MMQIRSIYSAGIAVNRNISGLQANFGAGLLDRIRGNKEDTPITDKWASSGNQESKKVVTEKEAVQARKENLTVDIKEAEKKENDYLKKHETVGDRNELRSQYRKEKLEKAKAILPYCLSPRKDDEGQYCSKFFNIPRGINCNDFLNGRKDLRKAVKEIQAVDLKNPDDSLHVFVSGSINDNETLKTKLESKLGVKDAEWGHVTEESDDGYLTTRVFAKYPEGEETDIVLIKDGDFLSNLN